jgi:catechol 2,3-dioxygenase-like lactoylglutathione lyase family enzyme
MYHPNEAHSDVRIGHVHLRVADLERATAFYRDVLGFDVTAYGPDVGLPGVAFLAAGGAHRALPFRPRLPRAPRAGSRCGAHPRARLSHGWSRGPRGDGLGVPA